MASRFEALELFVAVVDHEGFSAAARALGVSKSHVSKQVTALEDRLGARLLNRTTRQQTLTDSGRTLYDSARQVLADLQEAEQAITQLQECPRGTLRVSMPMSFGTSYLAEPIADFMAQYQRLAVEATLADRRVNLLEEGYDLAIRIGRLDDSSLIARKLAAYRMVAVGSPAYFAEHGRPDTPAALGAHQLLLYAYQHGGRSWTFRNSRGEQAVKVDGRLVANNGEVLLAAARQGLGLVWVPSFLVADDLAAGGLEEVLSEHSVSRGVWAVYPHSRHVSAKVRLFVDFLVACFAEPPWQRG